MHMLQLGTLVPLAVEAAPLFTEEPRSSLEAANLVNTQPIQNDSPVVSDFLLDTDKIMTCLFTN